ncbi:MAG: AgmX/PglI C-terminal domain-containing protein [Deltaproteobacteria bacterium]|nr:AgmX/PglI C-terminal domain-containing protein [Deltaproteobacteria bacterium]
MRVSLVATLLLVASFSVSWASWASWASAQDTAGAQAAISETRATTARVEHEIACLEGKHAALERVVRQMEEARQQLTAVHSSPDAREHARLAIVSLSHRAVRIERTVVECRTELSARARRPGPPEGTTHQPAPHDPAAHAVGQPNDPTRVIERDAVLQPNVGVVVGEQVDGTGRVAPEEVRAAIRGTAARYSRCYDRLVDRGALVQGTIITTFRVTRVGQTTNAQAHHGDLTDRNFVRCVAAATRRIRFSTPPAGGDAVYSYTLRFPGQ